METDAPKSCCASKKPATKPAWFKTYYPLLLIVGLIALVSMKEAFTFHHWMMHFMAGFFIVFSFFKLLDLKGFANTFATYDLLAAHSKAYGYVYPFLELALGFMFLFQFELTIALWASIILLGFGTIGVVKAVLSKQEIRCACLGTVLNLPMSQVTIVENTAMIVMSLWMLFG